MILLLTIVGISYRSCLQCYCAALRNILPKKPLILYFYCSVFGQRFYCMHIYLLKFRPNSFIFMHSVYTTLWLKRIHIVCIYDAHTDCMISAEKKSENLHISYFLLFLLYDCFLHDLEILPIYRHSMKI